MRVYDEAATAPLRSAPAVAPASAPELRHANLRTYAEWPSRSVGRTETLDRLPSPAATQSVRTLIQEIVNHEGPIHKMRLAKLVAGAYGLNKVHATRAQAILRCVPEEHKHLNDPATLWATGSDPSRWLYARRSERGGRS